MAIEQLKAGDTIQTYNHSKGKNALGVVKRAFARTTNKLCKLIIGGSLLISTL